MIILSQSCIFFVHVNYFIEIWKAGNLRCLPLVWGLTPPARPRTAFLWQRRADYHGHVLPAKWPLDPASSLLQCFPRICIRSEVKIDRHVYYICMKWHAIITRDVMFSLNWFLLVILGSKDAHWSIKLSIFWCQVGFKKINKSASAICRCVGRWTHLSHMLLQHMHSCLQHCVVGLRPRVPIVWCALGVS